MSCAVKKLIALCLALCLLLTGCGGIDLKGYFENLASALTGVTDFSKMEYTRPDMAALENKLNALCERAAVETDVVALTDEIWAFYVAYDDFSTAYALALIHYYQDLSDSYWEAEYNFCLENAAEADAALDRLYRALADCPLRQALESEEYFGPDYFDYYEGDSLYDDTLLALLDEESQILSRYYTISSEAGAVEYYTEEFFTLYGGQLADIYLELIRVRQKMAAHLGYEDYTQFAYDFYYYRDYTPQQAASYLADIRSELAPLYKQHLQSDFWDTEIGYSTEEETFAYVSSMAKSMGGQIGEAFDALRKGHLYDISFGENKYNASFEVYLPSYYQPFVFVNPMGNAFDQLAFAHEFGHFCSDYLSYGSVAGVDVAEVFSQGMEYLSLCYADGGEDLAQLKLADCLCLYVEQAALASFEQQVYGLTEEELTAENVQSLYTEICQAYGVATEEWDSRSYVTITHYFTNPMYIISYVVSNDAALQLYQLELKQKGAGLACLESNLTTTQGWFLAFLEEAGLTSPFEPSRITDVKQLMQQMLLDG